MWLLLSSPMNEGSLCLLLHKEISGSGPAREKESADHLSCVTPRQLRRILTLGVFQGLFDHFTYSSCIRICGVTSTKFVYVIRYIGTSKG